MEATHLNDERFAVEYQPVDPAKVMPRAGSEIDKLRAALHEIELMDYEPLSTTDRECFNRAVAIARAALDGSR